MHEQVIDLQDVQGLVRGFGRKVPVGEFLLLTIIDAGEFRKFLKELGPPATLEEWPEALPPETATNIAFTYTGLEALGLPATLLESFPSDFKQGMRARSEINADVGESEPARWEACWRDGLVHVWVGVYAQNGPALQAQLRKIRAMGEHVAFRVADTQPVGIITPEGTEKGVTYPPGTMLEHFGFADGLSEPAIEGVSRPEDYAGSKKSFQFPGSGWLPLAPGEFLLGHYKDEADERPVGPAMLELATNSTFMVYRKLRQNVSGFWEDLKERAKHLDDKTSADKITAVKLAEHMVGRRRDGTPLGYTNGNSGGAGVPVPRREHNTFDYSDDPHGARCPLGAHIRRANPRASLGFGTVLVDRHRILRRGIPYGPYSPKPEEADEKHERGLVFIALNASIARQFEFVQKRWMNDGNNFNMGNDRDPIAGNHAADSRFVMNAAKGGKQAVTICSGLRNYVTTRGGDYFFLPGLGGLRYLAEGSYHL